MKCRECIKCNQDNADGIINCANCGNDLSEEAKNKKITRVAKSYSLQVPALVCIFSMLFSYVTYIGAIIEYDDTGIKPAIEKEEVKETETEIETATGNTYSETSGVNVIDLEVGDTVGDFTVDSIVTKPNVGDPSSDYYAEFSIKLTGNHVANIKSINYDDEFYNMYIVTLEKDPVAINIGNKNSNVISKFQYLNFYYEELTHIFSENDLNLIRLNANNEYDISVPITIKEITSGYISNTGSFGDRAVIEARK